MSVTGVEASWRNRPVWTHSSGARLCVKLMAVSIAASATMVGRVPVYDRCSSCIVAVVISGAESVRRVYLMSCD